MNCPGYRAAETYVGRGWIAMVTVECYLPARRRHLTSTGSSWALPPSLGFLVLVIRPPFGSTICAAILRLVLPARGTGAQAGLLQAGPSPSPARTSPAS
jgi:hypothetical protein